MKESRNLYKNFYMSKFEVKDYTLEMIRSTLMRMTWRCVWQQHTHCVRNKEVYMYVREREAVARENSVSEFEESFDIIRRGRLTQIFHVKSNYINLSS